MTVEVTDETPVAELVACSQIETDQWHTLPQRHQRRLIHRAKRRLNVETARQMNLEQLADRDPDGEVLGWFRAVAKLLS